MTETSAEDTLIARYFAPLATHPGALGLRDDAASLAAGEGDLVITTDAIVAGVHFLPDDPAGAIARKALRVNLSDLAAKGADPAGFVLTLALFAPDAAFLAPFAQALGEDIAQFNCPLLGGDTVATPGPLMVSVTAFGRVPSGRMVQRRGARPGDAIAVTGTIGDATLGLALLQGRAALDDVGHRDALIDRYRVPQPRSGLAQAVRDHASAAMDVSDGLAGDLAKLCRVSGVTATIEADRIPLSPAAQAMIAAGQATLPQLIGGGDDYEILCTVPPARLESFVSAATAAGVPVAVVGAVAPGDAPPRIVDAAGRPLQLSSLAYDHFGL